MDSPSSGSLAPSPPSRRAAEAGHADPGPGTARAGDVVLVASLGDPVAADYAAHVGQASRIRVFLAACDQVRGLADAPVRTLALEGCGRLPTDAEAEAEFGPAPSLVVFIPPRLSEEDRRKLGELLELARRIRPRFVGIVGTFRVHLNDPDAEKAERHALSLFGSAGLDARVVVFRPGHVVSPHSPMSRTLHRLAPLHPLFPTRLATCFIDGEEFFAAIESERAGGDPGGRGLGDGPGVAPGPAGRAVGRDRRAYTLLGANTPWRDRLLRYRFASPPRILATALARALSWILVGQVMAAVISIAARWSRRARVWNVHTIRPRSMKELVSLCHPKNRDRVRVVGYNNGVNHFGHRYPGRTVVSTVLCRRTARAGAGRLKADCGTTIRGALDHLAAGGEELYVVPNYSYVSLGTAFFVPIHGSAIDYSTVADTIDRVVLYDPEHDRIVSASRGDAAFRENVYNPKSRAVVLRLYLRAKPKSGYFVRSETLCNPSASELLEALRDREATNVEIRQGHAASPNVTLRKYYKDAGDSSAPALELPRDALGRLWDQLEENPVTSFLMHALSRHVAWHTELFFTPAEFEAFWSTHAQVPLRKIQLRSIRRDGMPHSPFRDEDCVSADLFLFRTDKPRFDAYMRATLPAVRTNPGKHSN